MADHKQISSRALLGGGGGLAALGFGQIGSELWFPWQQIATIGLLWGKSFDHSSASFWICSSLFLQVMRTSIIFRMGSKFGKI